MNSQLPPAPSGIAPRKGSLHVWSAIADALAREIRAGAPAIGERLPTEDEMASRFGVHRNTVRRALNALVAQGLVRSEQGRGTFVQEPMSTTILGPHLATAQFLRDFDKGREKTITRVSHVKADNVIASALKIRRGTMLICMDMIWYGHRRPFAMATHYFPLPQFSGIDKKLRESASIRKAMLGFGIRGYRRHSTRVSARLPSIAEAKALDQPRTRPVLVLKSVNIDGDGKPVQFIVARAAAQRLEFLIEF